LFAETNHRIYSFVVTLLPASGDADEVFQRTSVILWRKFSEFRPGTDFVSWACRVAHLEALNYLRARQRDRLLFDEPLGAVRLPARGVGASQGPDDLRELAGRGEGPRRGRSPAISLRASLASPLTPSWESRH
jgi:RNA polymerase sigma factor (sigma-70 family)